MSSRSISPTGRRLKRQWTRRCITWVSRRAALLAEASRMNQAVKCLDVGSDAWKSVVSKLPLLKESVVFVELHFF